MHTIGVGLNSKASVIGFLVKIQCSSEWKLPTCSADTLGKEGVMSPENVCTGGYQNVSLEQVYHVTKSVFARATVVASAWPFSKAT